MKSQAIRIAILLFVLTAIVYVVERYRLLGWISFSDWMDYLYWILLGAYLLTLVVVISLLILEKNRPRRTLGWLLVILFLPLIGLGLYLFFGFNYRKRRLFEREEAWNTAFLQQQQISRKNSLKEPTTDGKQLPDRFSIEERLSIHMLFKNSGAPISGQNEVTILTSGEEKKEVLFQSLEEAREHIHLEYYLIREDPFGDGLSEVLRKKASEGVSVRLLYDDVGSWRLSNTYKKRLEKAGVELIPFMPVRFPSFSSRFNYRNHRKLAIIDGVTGFIGGMNINGKYLRNEPEPWRDLHLRIEGPAVHSLQAAFVSDWHFCTGALLNEPRYFPPETNGAGEKFLQIVASGPNTAYPGILHAYFKAIVAAKKYVYITTPYFIPNEILSTALETAALSGVDVRVVIPEEPDSKLAKWVSRSFFEPLMESGVSVFYFKPSFIHTKMILIDDLVASVGTANMDIRSMETNFEINAILYDRELTRRLKEQFLRYQEQSEKVNSEDFGNRPRGEKIKEGVARLLSPLM